MCVCHYLLAAVVSDLTLRMSQDSAFLHTLGGLSSPSGPLPVLLFPLCCRLCGLTLEEADLEGDKADAEGEGDGGQVSGPFLCSSSFSRLRKTTSTSAFADVSPLLRPAQRRTQSSLQPRCFPRNAASSAGHRPVPVPSLPLPVPLPQPPGPPRP